MSNEIKQAAEGSYFTEEEAAKIEQYKKEIKQCDMEKPYIFISYSKKDALRVYPLVNKLQEYGYNIWIDTRGLETAVGQNWQDSALYSIANDNCKAVFFMLSSHSLKSAPVFAEIMWALDGKPVDINHPRGITLKIVDTDGKYNLADGKILQTLQENVFYTDKTPLNDSDYDTMKNPGTIDKKYYEAGVNRITSKGMLASIFYDCLFQDKLGGGGNVTLANHKDIDTIIKNIPPECHCMPESVSSPAEIEAPATVKTTVKTRTSDKSAESPDVEKKKTKCASSTGGITYTIYGKEYTDNQANMMLNVFAKVLKKHPDAVGKLLADPEKPLIRCVSSVNYELPENKTESTPTRYYSGRYFNIGQGIFIGTGLNYPEKLRNIAQLLTICGEDFSILQSDQIELPSNVKIKWSGSGDEVYSIYGEEHSGNQTQMMVDALKFIMEKHFDKRDELAAQLLSIKLSPMSSLTDPYFRTGKEFSYQGITYSIGTSFGRQDKLKQIIKAINICGEDIENFQIEGLDDIKAPSKQSSSQKRDFLED